MNEQQTTAIDASTPWHKESYDWFLDETLPKLLAERLPLTGYSVKPTGTYTCSVSVGLPGDTQIEFPEIPRPDEQGVFEIDGKSLVVVPVASHDDLECADIRCVGEKLYDFVEERLGEAPADLSWDMSLAQAWLPFETWVRKFMQEHGQYLDLQNWLSRHTHLRRLLVADMENVFGPGHPGRTCSFETPEGPNIGRILTIANGAQVRGGRLVVKDDSPEGALAPAASMVPFLEHNDPNRQLMGVNMMRQWYVPPDPEPALVQTGNEPAACDFWCGRNLLTAFVSWGADTYEDGIVISESCAKRLGFPHAIEPGDKISNRHGNKDVISRILPDDEMPHLEDGSAVELVCSFMGVHTRLNFGQIREAVMSRIARAEGEPAVVPPFHAPSEEDLRERLRKANLPEDGMEQLLLGRDGEKLEHRSTVGWVYWGRTFHLAVDKLHVCKDGEDCCGQGELEYYVLRDTGSFENLTETYNTRSREREDWADLESRVEAGLVDQGGPPTPAFTQLAKRLAVGGIATEIADGRLCFGFDKTDENALRLAQAIPHPWLGDRMLEEVGRFEELPQFAALQEANTKLAHALESNAPESLRGSALAELKRRAGEFFDGLLESMHLRLRNRILFSGRTVLAPGSDLRIDQLGLAEEIAWPLFGPLVVRELGDRSAVEKRTRKAAKALDDIMARSWVILTRAPVIIPTALLAFHPVRIPDKVMRLHPLVCFLMNADFDGDQAAVFLPVTEAAQREAGERLSLAGHLARDPNLYELRLLMHEALWGLARLSLDPKGLREIEELAGVTVAAPDGFVSRETVAAAMREVVSRYGIENALQTFERLWRRGLDVTQRSGASISPFAGLGSGLRGSCAADEAKAWDVCIEELRDRLESFPNFADDDLGPQALAVKCGARGSVESLLRLTVGEAAVTDINGRPVPIKHGYVDGLTAEEMLACVAQAREGLARVAIECMDAGYGIRIERRPKGFNVLARAMRSERPGMVFARAAATGEVDPLTDLDSRLFVGLSP